MTQLLGDWLRAQADQRPDATALVAGAERRSFGELDRDTNRMARLLREAGCAPGDRVAILGPKGLATVTGILARLEHRGLIERGTSATDRRRAEARLTE